MASLLKPFQEIWIADCPGESSLSGELSINQFIDNSCFHMGILSRFPEPVERISYNKHVLIASGPQPQQNILIEEFIRIYSGTVTELTIITSSYDKYEAVIPKNISINLNPDDVDFINHLKTSSLVIARSGYSTIMDLCRLNIPALLIPTPGQTEQEFLAKHLSSLGFSAMLQSQVYEITSPEGLIWPAPRLKQFSSDQFILYKKQIARVLQKISQSG